MAFLKAASHRVGEVQPGKYGLCVAQVIFIQMLMLIVIRLIFLLVVN